MHFGVPGYVRIHCRHPVAKYNDSHDGGGDQQLSVNTEPCKVQTDLLSEVLSVRSEVRSDQEVRLGGESDSEFIVVAEQTVAN